MPWEIDGTLYPDRSVPAELNSLDEQVDFLARLCAAWDFGILPEEETVEEVRQPHWGQAVEACQLLTSPVYHLLRHWHHLKPLPYLGQLLPYIQNDPCLPFV